MIFLLSWKFTGAPVGKTVFWDVRQYTCFYKEKSINVSTKFTTEFTTKYTTKNANSYYILNQKLQYNESLN